MEFSDLVHTHWEWIYVCARKCLHSQEIDDLVQETLVVAWKNFYRLREWNEKQVAGFLRSVVRHKYLDKRKACRVRKIRTRTNLPWVLENAADHRYTRLATMVNDVMAELPEQERDILMCAGYGYTTRQIAESMGVTFYRADYVLRKAQKMARRALTGYGVVYRAYKGKLLNPAYVRSSARDIREQRRREYGTVGGSKARAAV